MGGANKWLVYCNGIGDAANVWLWTAIWGDSEFWANQYSPGLYIYTGYPP